MYRFLYFISWPFFRIFFPMKVKGRKNLKKGENYLFVANHRSNLDVLMLGSYIFRRQYFLAKKELFEKKSKARFLRTLGGIEIDRKGVGLGAMKKCLEILKKGKNLTIFPEGTRGNGDLEELKNGAALIALKAGVKICPIYLKKKPKAFSFNTLLIGEPFSIPSNVEGKSTKDLVDEAGNLIAEKMKNLEKIAKGKNKDI